MEDGPKRGSAAFSEKRMGSGTNCCYRRCWVGARSFTARGGLFYQYMSVRVKLGNEKVSRDKDVAKGRELLDKDVAKERGSCPRPRSRK